LSAELKQAFGVDAKLLPGSGGIFDVTVDGKLIYSKDSTGRFPQPGEVQKILQA
jgi:selenoprotein W-related protein